MSGQKRQPDDAPDLRQAANRVNRAVEDLVSTAADQLSSSAEKLSRSAEQVLNDTTSRLRARAGDQRAEPPAPATERRKFYRSRKNRKIAGLCGGLAEYFEVESWVVRCIAVTALIFMPQITFIGYWVAVLLTDKASGNSRQADAPVDRQAMRDHRSPAPELGPRHSPRNSMRNIRASFDRLELRLRRAEGYVTSSRYQLDRELHRLND